MNNQIFFYESDPIKDNQICDPTGQTESYEMDGKQEQIYNGTDEKIGK